MMATPWSNYSATDSKNVIEIKMIGDNERSYHGASFIHEFQYSWSWLLSTQMRLPSNHAASNSSASRITEREISKPNQKTVRAEPETHRI